MVFRPRMGELGKLLLLFLRRGLFFVVKFI